MNFLTADKRPAAMGCTEHDVTSVSHDNNDIKNGGQAQQIIKLDLG